MTRAALYNEAVTVMAEDAPWVPMEYVKLFPVMSKRVRNYFVHPLFYDRFKAVWLAQ